ncbi:hypothetical protein F4782DRAFT_235063 [Xylaria castorea]|nr:hypothetical protein F4782DRAFT_235063 [Xylaria castorea]
MFERNIPPSSFLIYFLQRPKSLGGFGLLEKEATPAGSRFFGAPCRLCFVSTFPSQASRPVSSRVSDTYLCLSLTLYQLGLSVRDKVSDLVEDSTLRIASIGSTDATHFPLAVTVTLGARICKLRYLHTGGRHKTRLGFSQNCSSIQSHAHL